MNYNWNWGIFLEPSPYGDSSYLTMLLQGLSWTLATAGLAALIALALGVVVGTLRTLPGKWHRRFANAYIELFRNIPLLVQFFLWFFVVPELLPQEWGTWLKSLPNAAFLTAVVCLGFFHSIRVAVMLSSGINSLSKGQKMAGYALGFTPAQTYRYVLLPMAFRLALPPFGSECLNIVKNSAVALTIGLMELTASARAMSEFSYQIFEAFTAATIIYLLVNVTILMLMRLLEKRTAVPGYFTSKPQSGKGV
ncbi:amino acid ABC transporter permease [Bosea sp. (in: a-proteobacteria)]|uniref:amino acid ABC transporter permease n=1 Tax=Bosea sp. (in: a-proteobacteria) TaxID=1871050 RepID=UPI002FC6E6C3